MRNYLRFGKGGSLVEYRVGTQIVSLISVSKRDGWKSAEMMLMRAGEQQLQITAQCSELLLPRVTVAMTVLEEE